ncbi:MAG: ABC transporter ATP-binding protein [Alphaproteobacteria bacterium]|nr:ABC transporter ATP-binding protein [Alphaproteobacteria bacterium]
MQAATLEIAGLGAGYARSQVLEDVSFTVPAGGRLCVFGRNGVGKSTLMAAIMGLCRRFTGDIRIDGQSVSAQGPSSRALGGIGLVPQTREIFRTLTVEENLIAGLKSRPRAAIDEAYELFPRLAQRRRNLGAQLSGGEQQMLSMARTILGKPRVLLLDEPLEGLAPVICDAVMAAIDRLAATGEMTILLVEQRLELAFEFGEMALVLERGRVVWSGRCDDLRRDTDAVERHIGVGGLGGH